MNINNIFQFFNEDYREDDETEMLIDFSEHPLFWIGGFNKIISNHVFFNQYTSKLFKNISPELNIEEIEKAGEYLMFEKAWGYIKNIDLNNSFHIECIGKKVSTEFLLNLNVAIIFYEVLEEYEKCALLKNIENKIKELKFKLGV
jgi:hypothetical protein